MAAAPGVGVVGSYSAPSDMKHNGLRKRLDILGFTQPLPLGAVPLVGAILEDLIRTTESLKAHKDHVHNLLQEKKAWDLGVEAYKCDNSKLLAEVSHLNKELIRQKDHYEAKKCDLSRRIRNLEMDKKYLEDHLQEMGERCEELEGKYQDLLDPKRKASRKPFVSTVRSGHIIPPQRDQHQQQCGHPHPMAAPPCPSRCPASARRKDLELDRDRLHRDSLTLQEQIEAQSKQIEVRDREIDRLNALLSTEGRPVKALAQDCCYRNVKQLRDDVEHLQRENNLLRNKLAHSVRTLQSREVQFTQAEKEVSFGGGVGGSGCRMPHPCEAHLVTCKMAQKSCEDIQNELSEKDKMIKQLQCELSKCMSDERNVEMLDKLSDSLCERVKLQDCYVKKLEQHQNALKQAGNARFAKANCENAVQHTCRKGANLEMADIQRQIECMRKELAQISNYSQGHDAVKRLQCDLASKECEINTLKNKNCLSSSSVLNTNRNNFCDSNRSSVTGTSTDLCRTAAHTDRSHLERDNNVLAENLSRLTAERDHLKCLLEAELQKIRVEREAFNNTLDKLKCQLDQVEREKMDLLCRQEPKNAAIMDMKSDVRKLQCQIDLLRDENSDLKCEVDQFRMRECQKDKQLTEKENEICEKDLKIKQMNRKLNERDGTEGNLIEDINRLNADLRRCNENYSGLESENARIRAQLCEKLEDAKKLQCESDLYKEDQNKLIKQYDAIKRKYNEQIQMITSLDSRRREMCIQVESYKEQVERLRKDLDNSQCENKHLADQLSRVECELSNTNRLLTESQHKSCDLSSKMKDYLLEVERVKKLLDEKEKERDEMLDNMKKLSENTCRLRSNNIAMGSELCHHKHELEDAKKQICDLTKMLDCKEAEMQKLKDEVNKSLEEVCLMRADLEKCYETHKKLHDENAGLRKGRQEMIMNIQRLKNELETWKKLHDEMKTRNDKLKRELKSVQCDDYPNNVKKLQEILAQNREDMETHMRKMACLTTELAETKDQFARFKSSVEEENCKSTTVQDDLKQYVAKACEVEKTLASIQGKYNLDDRAANCKHVSIVTPCGNLTNSRRHSDPEACSCKITLESKNLVVQTPQGDPLLGEGLLTIKRPCNTHPVQRSPNQREIIPIQRSRSYNPHVQCGRQACIDRIHRHQSSSPPPGLNVSRKAQCQSNSIRSPRGGCHNIDPNAPLDKMCAELNMSGLISIPDAPRVSMTSLCGKSSTCEPTAENRLFDDVRKHGQSKRQWSTHEEIEQRIQSFKEPAKVCTGAAAATSNVKAPANTPAGKCDSATVAHGASKVFLKVPELTVTAPNPPRRLDVPRRSLVDKFVGQPKDDDKSKTPECHQGTVKKGFNHVMQELKSITHNIFGRPEDHHDGEPTPSPTTPPAPALMANTVKDRIQKFQEIVNDAKKTVGTPAVYSRAQSLAPSNTNNVGDAAADGAVPQGPEVRKQSLIRKVISTIARDGLQGLSTLHRDDDTDNAANEEPAPPPKPTEDRLAVPRALPPAVPRPSTAGPQAPNAAASSTTNSAPLKGILSSPRGRFSLPPQPEPTQEPNTVVVRHSRAASISDDNTVIDLTSLKGGAARSSGIDSEVEFLPSAKTNIIHTVSSETRQDHSRRSTAPDSDDRFHTMVHTEPNRLRHGDYNKFARSLNDAFILSSSSDNMAEPPAPTSDTPSPASPLARRRTMANYRKPDYQHVGHLRGPLEAPPLRDLGMWDDRAAMQQDDGCVITSSASDSTDTPRDNSGFVNANTAMPIQRGGRSIVTTRDSPGSAMQGRDRALMDFIRAHDSGHSLPFSMGGEEEPEASETGSSERRDLSDHLHSASESNEEDRYYNPQRPGCRGGLIGGSEDFDVDHDEYANMDDESDVTGNYYGPFVMHSDSKSGTTVSFPGPYHGTDYSADDSLQNLEQHLRELCNMGMGVKRTASGLHQQQRQQPMGSQQSYAMGNRIKQMPQYVHHSVDENYQRHYLDGLQSSVDDMVMSGTSSGTQPMKFFCSISKSMDESNPELNVNLMLLGNGEGEDGEEDHDDEDDRSVSPSCRSESTQKTHATSVTVDTVYLTYSRPNLTESLLMSVADCYDDMQGGGESTLTAYMDSQASAMGKQEKEVEFNEEFITKFLDNIIRSNNLLSTSDELSLASASAPALQCLTGDRQ